MSNVWRFTGPPENWITAIGKGYWALNDENENLWEQIEQNDIALFHSTSSKLAKVNSVIAGYAVIGKSKFFKEDLWWKKEIDEKNLIWKYAFSLDQIYLFKDSPNIDFGTDINKKDLELVKREIQEFTSQGFLLKKLNTKAKAQNPSGKAFPVNGSGSRILNPTFEELLLDSDLEFFALNREAKNFAQLEKRQAPLIDQKLAEESEEETRKKAENFKDTGPSHTYSKSPRKLRKENAEQKRRIAKLEKFTCQLCSFNYEYKTASGKTAWIIEVDHIIPKADGHGEKMSNLCVLCPTCHEKKTRRIIKIDSEKKKIFENEKQIFFQRDNHLGWGTQ